MASTAGKCRTCEKPASLKCSGCHNVFYCGTEHQKQDWKSQHKNECRNFEIKVSDKLGYHLVATRDIKINDVIVSELPLALGTSHRKRQKVHCIGCHLRNKHFPADQLGHSCPECGFAVCNPKCPGLSDPARHAGGECALFASSKGPIVGRIFMMQSPSRILVYRCFLVQQRNPEKWKMMKEMGARALREREDEKMNEGQAGVMAKLSVESVLGLAPGHFKDFCAETVDKIYALLDFYGLWLGSPADRYLIGFYGTASLLQQHCLPNTTLCCEEQPKVVAYSGKPFMGRITVRAIKNIKKGEVLTIMRGIMPRHATFCTMGRHSEFFWVRGLRCKCTRCLDPTELGLHTATVKCGKCSGWIMPITPSKIDDTDWRCTGSCGRRLDADSVQKHVQSMGDELEKPFLTEDQQEKLLKKFEIHLHPMHQLCLCIKTRLAAFYGESFTKDCHQTNMTGFSDAELERRLGHCKDALAALEILGPINDVIAGHYACCLLNVTRIEMELLKRKFEAGKASTSEAVKIIDKSRASLRRLMVILRFGTTNEVRTQLIGQAAFDDRALMDWVKQKKIQIDSV